jgi:DUF2075 family protein
MLDGNPEFLMIDEQKLVYETAIHLAHEAQRGEKQTIIVQGGPGTGKSVVAINLLAELTKREMLVQYVSKNAAPREVFKKRLTGTRKKNHIDQMFKGSGAYTDTKVNQFGALIVDEAHRLNEKSGLYSNLGENQIKELINSSRLSIFFIDEAQRVTLKDIGRIDDIRFWAKQLNSTVTELKLESQFRCNGSDGYLAWIDNSLQIRETANPSLDDIDYEVKVFDDPRDLRTAITEKNRLTNRARIVAGYCWDWNSKKDSATFDIVIPEFDFKAQWNLADDGSLWLIAEHSVEQIGCIHTCQGLEVDYIGVIIGDDFVIRDGMAITDATKRSKNDRSVFGFKKKLKEDRDNTEQLLDEIIKNTYRTLMTRGQKGCYIFCTDPETREYFQRITQRQDINEQPAPQVFEGLELKVVSIENAKPYDTHVPIYDLHASAGDFSTSQFLSEHQWVELPDHINAREGMFVMRVIGESMNRRIPNGSWCLFKTNPGGTRNGKVVLVQHRSIEDPDHGGSYTVKVYHSEKAVDDETKVNSKVVLKPDTNAFGYSPIMIEDGEEGLMIVGEYLGVIAF